MAAEERKRVVKTSYKYMLWMLKHIPFLIASLYFINSILDWFDINIEILSFMFGMSLVPWLFLLISSIVFQFCICHRIFIYYIGVIESLQWIDHFYTIPISDLTFFVIIIGLFVITCALAIYFRYHAIHKRTCHKDAAIGS